MEEKFAEAISKRMDETSDNLPLLVGLVSLAVIALFPLAGSGLQADLHLLSQALPVLGVLTGR